MIYAYTIINKMVPQIRLSDTACLQNFSHSYPGAQSWWKIGEAVSWLPSGSLLSVDEEEEENRFSTVELFQRNMMNMDQQVFHVQKVQAEKLCFFLICWQF